MTHVLRLHKHEVKANFKNKLWQKCDLKDGDESSEPQTQTQVKMDNVSGLSRNDPTDDRYIINEVHTYASLENGESDELPYIITYLVSTKKVLAVRRNWVETDVN